MLIRASKTRIISKLLRLWASPTSTSRSPPAITPPWWYLWVVNLTRETFINSHLLEPSTRVITGPVETLFKTLFVTVRRWVRISSQVPTVRAAKESCHTISTRSVPQEMATDSTIMALVWALNNSTSAKVSNSNSSYKLKLPRPWSSSSRASWNRANSHLEIWGYPKTAQAQPWSHMAPPTNSSPSQSAQHPSREVRLTRDTWTSRSSSRGRAVESSSSTSRISQWQMDQIQICSHSSNW